MSNRSEILLRAYPLCYNFLLYFFFVFVPGEKPFAFNSSFHLGHSLIPKSRLVLHSWRNVSRHKQEWSLHYCLHKKILPSNEKTMCGVSLNGVRCLKYLLRPVNLANQPSLEHSKEINQSFWLLPRGKKNNNSKLSRFFFVILELIDYA